MHKIYVIIPALNEEFSIAKVIADIPKNIVELIIVADNGSTDNTAAVAQNAGALVISEPKPGYGAACLAAINHIKANLVEPHIIVFIDGDYSDYPEQLPMVVAPIIDQNIDMVIGSRALGNRASGSMTLPQVFGNWLASKLLKLWYKADFTDLGPFRAIKYDKLMALGMRDTNYGWTVEMQVKAIKSKLTYTEVPVDYRPRIGQSKVSGTVKGVIGAGYKIIKTLIQYA